MLGKELEYRLGIETRVTVLSHAPRGGIPAAFDQVLVTRFGVSSVEQIVANSFSCMVALEGNRNETFLLKDVVSKIKPVTLHSVISQQQR